jgi:methylenetetrahydrofolate reductase (NADPH)
MNTIPEQPAGGPLPKLEGHTSTGRLERVLRAGHFTVTAELAPPDSALAEDVYERARLFDGYVDGMNATDGSGAHCHMSSVAMCALLTNIGYSPVLQISCRDKNRIAIQGDVLGAAAMGVSNILCLSGDGVQVGDHPEAKPVFDLDSMSLLEMIRIMRDESRFLSGRERKTPVRRPSISVLTGSPRKLPRVRSLSRPSTYSILNRCAYLWQRRVILDCWNSAL